MGTIADKLDYLNDTKTAVKNAIVAKGVDVPDDTPFRQYADKIGTISGGGGGAFGVTVNDILGVVDSNGVLQQPTEQFTLDLMGVKTVANSILIRKLYLNNAAKAIIAPDVTTIQDSGMSYIAFYAGIEEINLAKLALIKINGLERGFGGCKLKKALLPNLAEVESGGMAYCFDNNSLLSEVDVGSLMILGSLAFQSTFSRTAIQSISFPALYSVANNSFGSTSANYCFSGCTQLTEIHFNKAAQANIEAMTGYAAKWGATNATIYFDL